MQAKNMLPPRLHPNKIKYLYVLWVLTAFDFSTTKAARYMGISKRTLNHMKESMRERGYVLKVRRPSKCE